MRRRSSFPGATSNINTTHPLCVDTPFRARILASFIGRPGPGRARRPAHRLP